MGKSARRVPLTRAHGSDPAVPSTTPRAPGSTQRQHRPTPTVMAYQLNFNSDNCTSACPEVMEALIAANSGERGSYGIDAETARVAELLKAAFETEALQSYPVATGTAANALAVASSTASYQALFCTRAAHLYEV